MKTIVEKNEIELIDIELINELEQIELRGGNALRQPLEDTQVGCNVDQCNCNSCK